MNDATAEFGANSVTIFSGFGLTQGSLAASKDVSVGRSLFISQSGGPPAELWYSRRSGDSVHEDETLYLRKGNIATETGSIGSSKDVIANRYFTIGTQANHATLWHSAFDTGANQGPSLWLKSGDLATEEGDIASTDFETNGYFNVRASEGYGQGKAQLYFSATEKHGSKSGSLYLKKGDFRLEDGSIFSETLVAGESLKLGAAPTFGSGEAKLWYVDTPAGAAQLESNSLYLESGDLSTHNGDVIAAKNMGGQSIKVFGSHGHGRTAELWFGRPGGDVGGLDSHAPARVLYVRTGNFATENGDLVAKLDARIEKGSLRISAHPGYGASMEDSVHAQLWYSHLGQATTPKETLHLAHGKFNVQRGSLRAHKDVVARNNLSGNKAEAGSAKCSECHFQKIYLKQSTSENKDAPHALRDSLVLIDEGKTQRMDLGLALSELHARRDELSREQTQLKAAIARAHTLVVEMESRVQARRLL
jgi:hypothetical protein